MVSPKANAILADYYDLAVERAGRPQALHGLRQIISKGVKILVEMPLEKSNDYVRNVVDQFKAGRLVHVVEDIAADVQDISRERKQEYIVSLTLPDGAQVSFLPDVDIPNTPENVKAWTEFLGKVSPRHRRGFDPTSSLSGRAPFRDGVWFGDLVFDLGLVMSVHRDIREVRGSLKLSSDRLAVDHKIKVTGDLHADADLVRTYDPCLSRLDGDMHLYGDRLGSPAALAVGPEDLARWGLAPGRRLLLNDTGEYRFEARERDRQKVHVLTQVVEGRPSGHKYAWDGSAWRRLEGDLPLRVANAVRLKLNKVRVYLGLSRDFVVDHTDQLEENITRLTALLDLFLALSAPGGGSVMDKPLRELVGNLAASLASIGSRAMLDGLEDEDEVMRRAGEIESRLEEISEERLRTLQAGLAASQLQPVDPAALKNDRRFLERLTAEDVTVPDILSSPGRTIVFLNNIFLSKEAKARAAELIKDLRAALRELLGKQQAERVLIALLRRPDPKLFAALRQAAPKKRDELAAVKAAMEALKAMDPMDILRSFHHASYPKESESLLLDRAFLLKLLQFKGGDVDELFSWVDERGTRSYDLDKFRNALWVNLESFIAEDIRRRNEAMADKSPREIVRLLNEKILFLAPVVKAYNTFAG